MRPPHLFRLRSIALALILIALVIPLVHADTIDSYVAVPDNAKGILDDGRFSAGQCFKPAVTAILSTASLMMLKTGSPTTPVFRYDIFPTTGSYGSSCTGSQFVPIASSSTMDGSSLTSTATSVMLAFTGANQIVLTGGTAYIIAATFVSCGSCSSSNLLGVGFVNTGAHAGNLAFISGAVWSFTAAADAPFVVSGTTTSTPGQQSQCYGNCGSLVNTNSTHTINFNSSQTLFYAAQSNLNGFVINVTTTVAKTYTNGITLYLGLYTVEASCTNGGQAPFSPQCPGFIAASSTIVNPAKGQQFLATNVGVVSGQWIGVAISSSFAGLDINDTSVTQPIYKTGGIMPGTISQFTVLSQTSKIALFATILGLPPGTSTGGGGSGVGCQIGLLPCEMIALQNALGGGIFGGLAAFGIIFGLSVGAFILLDYAVMAQINKNRVNPIKTNPIIGEGIIVFFGVIELIGFSVIGIIPAWIPLLLFAVFAWLLGQTIWSHRGSGSGGMA